MAGAPVSPDHIRAGQEAMARNPAPVAGTIEAGVIGDLRDGQVQAGLERAAMRTPSFTGIRNLEEGNIGHKDNLNVVQRNANEVTLHNTATARIDLLQDFIDNGYGNMGANQATLLNEVTNAILGSADMAGRFSTLPPGQSQTEAARMAQEYLNDPNFRGIIIDLVMQRADLSHPIPDNVSELAIKLADLQAERTRITQANGEQATAVLNETNAQSRLNRYLEDPGGVVTNNGQFYIEIGTQTTALNNAKNVIQTLETNTIPNLETQIQTLDLQQQQILKIQTDYEMRKHPNPNYVPQNPVIPNDPNQWLSADQFITSLGLPDLATVRQNLITESAQLRAARLNLASEKTKQSDAEVRIKQINEEKGRAEQTLKDAQTKRSEIDTRLAKLDKDINEQTGKYNKAQTEKELQETKWVTELDNIIKDATSQRLHGELPIAAQKIRERMEKRAEEATDNNSKLFWNQEKQRYIGPDGRPIKANIDLDRQAIMRGAATVNFTGVDSNNNPINANLVLNGAQRTLVERMAAGPPALTPGEVYEIIKDKTVLTKMSNDLAQDILTTHLWSGGRLSKGEIISIHRSEWGKGMVAQAMTGRADLQAQVDAVVGKGVLKWNEDIMAQLGKIDWSKFAMILLIIAGVVGGGSLALGAMNG